MVFSWQTSPFNADVSPSVDSISERPILFIKFSVNKKAIAVQRSECEIQIFIEKPSRYLPTNAGQDQRAFSDSFGVTLHYVTLQFDMDLLACNNLIAVICYIFFLDVRSGKLQRAPAKDDDWRLLSVHTQTGTAERFAKVSCFETLLGSPTFVDIRNERLRCVETGHEVVAGDKEAYARNKRCRLGLIDHALSHGKSPLTMFLQCLISHSKFVCKLIGDTVNKNEEHILKYVNGKRFLHRLDY
ncbi:hypothetical protein F2Q69_00031872 [Brassica cretica]|uniref:Regulator of MON1-CCZ1 complex N-terminal domain-containing protein n=1 Tax=Brassica cretica TaxID=69181 RepID=A0A8S9RW78_BRACR|nr:hypothetical protein F2Q69_00031872 [Brassica cretica]